MKKLNVLIVVLLSTVLLISCGQPSETNLTVSTSGVSGEQEQYVEIVPGTYKLAVKEESNLFLPIKLKVVKDVVADFGNEFSFGWGCNLYVVDEAGLEVPGDGLTSLGVQDEDMLKKLLTSPVGTEMEIVFVKQYTGKKDAKLILKEGKSLVIRDFTIVTAEDSSISSSATDASSDDWDAILDDYDNFVTKYISAMNKAANGDMDASEEMMDLMTEAQELGSKLGSASSELTSAQMTRYTKILNKMSSVY